MKIEKLIDILNARPINIPEGYVREIEAGYCGDFLSFVMNRAPENSAWFTVMTNLNVAAVAALTDVGCVVVCEGSKCDSALINKAAAQNICIIETDFDIFEAVKRYITKQ